MKIINIRMKRNVKYQQITKQCIAYSILLCLILLFSLNEQWCSLPVGHNHGNERRTGTTEMQCTTNNNKRHRLARMCEMP